MRNTQEAEFIIRIGDVDNLGFGWPLEFDPFCGRITDRILIYEADESRGRCLKKKDAKQGA